MSESRIAAQMYTLREFTQTPADIASTMKKVKAMGYDSVQLSALGPIETAELKRILDGEGLSVCATHTSFQRMRDETDSVIEEHKLLGCRYAAIGGLPAEYRSEGGYSRFAKEASAVAKRLAQGGLVFGYHNHSFELERFGRRTGLDILYSESDAQYFTAEIDTYWVQHGGGDPAEWIRKVSGRIPLLHLKDMTVNAEMQQLMAEVGEGNLNWPAILDAARQSGVVWYIIEQDTCQRDPFESLAISLRNLREMGIK
ncbi:MAG: sugar phosphate isomerase/epimerase [Armatimonadota bacterium]|nr:sugar phosphate isomerase/epimerase [Armatimonadota bacterium]